MKRVQAWLEQIYERRLKREYDTFALVVGGEGVGKSTFTLEVLGRYLQLRDDDQPGPDDILDAIVWNDRQEFKEHISSRSTRSAVAVPDAARVLHRKQAMAGDQVELEKDLLDVRMKEFLFLLGYQDWGVVASILAERRAHFVFRIPSRGRVEAYSRHKIDKKVEEMRRDEWPEPDWVDTFPNLDGTEIWDQYQETDLEMKNQRMEADSDPDPESAAKAAQRRVALRAYFKRPDETYKSISRLVDYSDSWVGNTIQDWEDGEIDPFGDDEPNIPAPSAGHGR